MAEQTFSLPAARFNAAATFIEWNYSGHVAPSVDTGLRVHAETTPYLFRVGVQPSGAFFLAFSGASVSSTDTERRDLSALFESSGSIELSSGSHSVLIPMAGGDSEEPYAFTPSDSDLSSAITAFANAFLSSTDGTVAGTLTLRDFVPVAPAFADDTGDAFTGTVGTAITDITVPEATGMPAPTYAVVGSLPDGLSFDTSTRVISGTPEAAGSGTITIRATNSVGTDDWTVAYTFRSPMYYGGSNVVGFRYGTATPSAIYYGTNRVF